MVELKDKKSNSTIDVEEFQILVRKYKLFEESDYIDKMYEAFGKYRYFDIFRT